MTKARVATLWLDGCSGCHMSFLDLDERLLEIAGMIELVYSPVMDAKEFPEGVDLTLVEGAIASDEDVEKIKMVRGRTKLLVALGDCAVTGNVPAMRNSFPLADVLRRGYVDNATANPGAGPRSSEAGKESHSAARTGAGGSVCARMPALGGPDLFCPQRGSCRARTGPGLKESLWQLAERWSKAYADDTNRWNHKD